MGIGNKTIAVDKTGYKPKCSVNDHKELDVLSLVIWQHWLNKAVLDRYKHTPRH